MKQLTTVSFIIFHPEIIFQAKVDDGPWTRLLFDEKGTVMCPMLQGRQMKSLGLEPKFLDSQFKASKNHFRKFKRRKMEEFGTSALLFA